MSLPGNKIFFLAILCALTASIASFAVDRYRAREIIQIESDVEKALGGSHAEQLQAILTALRSIRETRLRRATFGLPPYDTTPISSHCRGENLRINNRAIYYQTESEREIFKLHFTADGKVLLNGKPFSTEELHAETGVHYYLYVMDAEGNFYVTEPRRHIYHSSLLAGADAAGAGTIEARDGKARINVLTNGSGHYDPSLYFLLQPVESLLAKGVDLSHFSIRYISGRNHSKIIEFSFPKDEWQALVTGHCLDFLQR